MPEFKEADVVQLKSGGPRMTIYEVRDDEVICQWFNKENELQVGGFKKTEVEKVS